MVVRADWCLGADRQLWDAYIACWVASELERSEATQQGGRPARHHRDGEILLLPEEVALRVVEMSTRIGAVVASLSPSMKRRAFLGWSTFGAASLPAAVVAGGLDAVDRLVSAGRPGRAADGVAVEQLRDTVDACRRLDDAGMCGVVLQTSRRALARADELVRSSSSEAARRPLALIAAELSQIAGWAAVELDDHDRGRRHVQRAITAADEARSAELHSHILSLNVSYAEGLQGNARAAVDAAAAALDWARQSGDPTTISFAQYVAARAWVRAGDERGALDALEQSDRHLERCTGASRPAWLYWYDRADALSNRGQCHLDLHRAGKTSGSGAGEAVAAFRAAASARDHRFTRERAHDHLDLTDAYEEDGEREMAARHASDAVVLAAGMDSRRVRQRLEQFHTKVQADPLPAARDFSERYRTLIRG
jgi:hypothetical protein